MVNPVGGSNSSPWGSDQNSIPPGPPLPADNPWVKALALLFPGVPLGEIQMYAAKFQANMFQALNNEINRDLKKARAAAKKLKDAIEGND
ncbi:MAG: hypothetical protein ACRDF4_10935 [Rhabdochlamydiaceae bacterium]